MTPCDCDKCEEFLQPFLDRELSEAERLEAEAHLDRCDPCRRRYRFEAELRRYVKQVADVPMPPDLKERLSALRIVL